MRIAITGAAGRLGREVVAEALRQNHEVIGIDRVPVDRLPAYPGLLRRAADVTDYAAVLHSLESAEAMIHLAVEAGGSADDATVHNGNVTGSYNALRAAAECGIRRVCMGSSVNAIGLSFSRRPRFQYFPVDEQHTTFNEDPYGLSKWIGEVQAASMARRHPEMTICSLRLHWLVSDRGVAREAYSRRIARGAWELWSYTLFTSAVRACLRSLEAGFKGHEIFNIVAPDTALDMPSAALARQFYPGVPIRGAFTGNQSFFTSAKAARLLGC